jgi:hypothetical protein
MAASRIIEEETGTWSGLRHKHNGYYAGDFSDAPFRPLAPLAGSDPARLTVRANWPSTREAGPHPRADANPVNLWTAPGARPSQRPSVRSSLLAYLRIRASEHLPPQLPGLSQPELSCGSSGRLR